MLSASEGGGSERFGVKEGRWGWGYMWMRVFIVFFFFKQKTAYEIYQCDWSSDVCSSDLKVFNDTEGHLAGDHILKEIASIMTGTVRANDILVRFGGEEFAIIMPQTSQEEAFHVAERVRENIKTLILPTWKRFPKEQITVSIGLAMYPESGDPMENIIRYADRALYKAKMRGKDLTLSWNDGADNPKDEQNVFSTKTK